MASALSFWSPVSNTFFFRARPSAPTLFDVAAITGLCPHGTILSLAFSPEGTTEFDALLDPKVDLGYFKFMKRFVGQGQSRSNKEEHIAFLSIGFVIVYFVLVIPVL